MVIVLLILVVSLIQAIPVVRLGYTRRGVMLINLAENIRRLRKEHSMTQEQVANALGVTVGAVYKWESGQSLPEIRLLMEIAD